MSAMEDFIAIKNVSKSFGGIKAVRDISFQIGSGEFFSLLGPSGCGKTTLLRMLAGFEMPTAGDILIDGQRMSTVPANRRPTNMVFQNYAIFPHLDVERNIAYGLRNQRLDRQEIGARVQEALRLIKLTGYGSRRANQLSGGERQRVALARALVCKPKVLLLDEPLGALDKKLREEMQLELRQLQRSVGITFIFVTHDQEEALTMSDRIAVMSKGRILQIDTAERLYEVPRCREVAGFIGTMNFIDGSLIGANGDMGVVDAGAVGQLLARFGDGERLPMGRVTLAVRPEKLRISDSPFDANAFNSIRGRLVNRAYLGDRSHYYVEVANLERPLAVAAQNVERDLHGGQMVGKEVWIGWRAEAGILLGETDGAAAPSPMMQTATAPTFVPGSLNAASGGAARS
jgi:spermidine/putrescine ABC transporter ATP-binding subunit